LNVRKRGFPIDPLEIIHLDELFPIYGTPIDTKRYKRGDRGGFRRHLVFKLIIESDTSLKDIL